MTKACTVCDSSFEGDPRKLYCSDSCKWKAHGLRRGLTCADCGKPMVKGSGSRPQGEAVCHPCQRARPGYVGRAPAPSWPRDVNCARCGGLFSALTSANRWCSPECTRARDCDTCGETFTPGGSGTGYWRTTCNDCSAMLRKKHWPRSHVSFVDCLQCGVLFATRLRGRLCSDQCRRDRVRGWSLARKLTYQPKLRTIECEECGTAVEGTRRRRFCSSACSGRYGRRLRKPGGLKLTTVARERIYARDDYACHLCGFEVAEVDDPHPWAPTLDHVVPRSLGGSDDPENLRTAHRWCNTVRGVAAVPTTLYPLPPLTWDTQLFLAIKAA